MQKKRTFEDADAGTLTTYWPSEGYSWDDLTSVIPAITSRRAWDASEYGVHA